MKKVAIILSGSGVFDGAEVHESVLTMLAVSELKGEYQCFAPNIEQLHVINHLTGEAVEGQTRNVLEEAARIARGDVQSLEKLNIDEFDGLILPGGFGVAKNLCDFAINGCSMTVEPSVLKICQQFAEAKKPAAYACIAPVIVPRVYPNSVRVTIGNDPETAKMIESMGGVHVECRVEEVAIDQQHRLVSTPAYMLASNISEAKASIDNMVRSLFELIDG